jgi:hypothetical protein
MADNYADITPDGEGRRSGETGSTDTYLLPAIIPRGQEGRTELGSVTQKQAVYTSGECAT